MYVWREIVFAGILKEKRRKLWSAVICTDMLKGVRSKHSVI